MPVAMMQHSRSADTSFQDLHALDLVALHPGEIAGSGQMFAASRDSIDRVFGDFLAAKGLTREHISILDGFLFAFNDRRFAGWHALNWWDQRTCIREIKDHALYTGRAQALLARSRFAPYIAWSDDMVAKSTDPEVKRAWMRKRLVLQECFWNALDSFSHAAYFKKKYKDMFPALCVLLCTVIDKNGRETELVLGIDNGTGFLYKKKSRESALLRLLYIICKCFFRRGVFYIGGLELGLMETDGELSCHGSGAVVYQGW